MSGSLALPEARMLRRRQQQQPQQQPQQREQGGFQAGQERAQGRAGRATRAAGGQQGLSDVEDSDGEVGGGPADGRGDGAINGAGEEDGEGAGDGQPAPDAPNGAGGGAVAGGGQAAVELLICTFSPDGSHIVTGSNDCSVYMWHWAWPKAADVAKFESGGGNEEAQAGGQGSSDAWPMPQVG